MKIFKHSVLAASIMACFATNTYSQSTTTGHIALGGQQNTHYLGWQNNAIPLFLRTGNHNGNQNRMLIRNGGFGNNGGKVAMGNNLPNNFTPRARLHLHQNGGFTNLRFTTDGTGSTANDGFSMGMANNGNAAFINHELGGNFTWFNQGNGLGTLLNRMILFDGETQAS